MADKSLSALSSLAASDLPLPALDASSAVQLSDDQNLAAGQAEALAYTDSLMLLSQLGQRSSDPTAATVMAGVAEGRPDGGGRPVKAAHGGLGRGNSGVGEVLEASTANGLSSGLPDFAKGGNQPGVRKNNLQINDVARAKADHSHHQTSGVAVDIRADKLAYVASGNEISTLVAQTNMANNSDGASRQGERNNAKPASIRSSTNPDGAWGPQALYSGSPLDVMPTTATDALVPPEMMVAEQVSYWISQDVQNAELSLDGFDGLPVDVSITLQGKEARVDFRTDQEGIREVLQNTEAHLKDMLAKEGLVLSSVSVGTSNQQGRGTAERKNPENKRRAEIAAAVPVSASGLRRPINVSEKSIDVFV